MTEPFKGPLYDLLRQAAVEGKPTPKTREIVQALDLPNASSVGTELKRLADAGLLVIEPHPETISRRRVIFPDGKLTVWTAKPAPPNRASVLKKRERNAQRLLMMIREKNPGLECWVGDDGQIHSNSLGGLPV